MLVKKIVGLLILVAVIPIYVYGFARFGFRDVLIPGLIASAGGFVILGGIWLVRYSGKEASRS